MVSQIPFGKHRPHLPFTIEIEMFIHSLQSKCWRKLRTLHPKDTADVFIKLFILGENELHDLREKKILKIRDETMC